MSRNPNAALLLLVAACSCGAAESDGAARSPADLTNDERRSMMAAAAGYQNCVYSEGMASIGRFADIRQAADYALTACTGKLDDIRTEIAGFGVAAGFGEQFAKRIRHQATRRLLPELAIRKAGG